jgi:acetyl esterase/lipase
VRRAALLALALLAALSAELAAAAAEPAVVLLWPRGAPEAKGEEEADRPSLTVHLPPAGSAARAAVVVCPGGGYGFLAVEHEGREVAEWLNAQDVAAFVLRYRIAPRYRHPAPIQDAGRAIRTVRARAAEWGVDPDRIGILGFSAGGHLAATAGTRFDDGRAGAEDPVERASSRPDFLVLVYPVISFTEPWTHQGSRRNLLGDGAGPDLAAALSAEKQVTARTPPAFLVHTSGDRGVPAENSVAFYLALRAAGVPAEMHVYERGEHGFGLARRDPVLSKWPDRLREWLEVRGVLRPAAAETVVKAPDGVPIAYDARGKGGTALVFLHGLGSDRTSWRGQLDLFAVDYRVVNVDLGGHGSSGTGRESWTVAGLAGDVEAVVKALDLERVVLVGHSMGGHVALFAAARMPGRVIGIIGVDTLQDAEFRWPEAEAARMIESFERDFAQTMDAAVRSMFPAGADPALVERIAARASAANRPAVLGLLRDFPRLDLPQAFRGARVPVRCINSAPWREGTLRTAVETNRKYADYDAIILEGTGHYPMLERPAELNARLRQAVAALAAGAPRRD